MTKQERYGYILSLQRNLEENLRLMWRCSADGDYSDISNFSRPSFKLMREYIRKCYEEAFGNSVTDEDMEIIESHADESNTDLSNAIKKSVTKIESAETADEVSKQYAIAEPILLALAQRRFMELFNAREEEQE